MLKAWLKEALGVESTERGRAEASEREREGGGGCACGSHAALLAGEVGGVLFFGPFLLAFNESPGAPVVQCPGENTPEVWARAMD